MNSSPSKEKRPTLLNIDDFFDGSSFPNYEEIDNDLRECSYVK